MESAYRRHAHELTGYAIGLVGPAGAEDIVSSAFVKAMTCPSWVDVENPRAYLYRVVLNEARTEHRNRERRRIREATGRPETSFVYPDPVPEISAAIDRLSERQRQVVLMAYWADLSEVDIADTLGISRGSVRKHLGRARIALRTLLDSFAVASASPETA